MSERQHLFFKPASLPIGKFPWMVFWWWGWVVVGGNGIAGNPSQASLSIQLLLLIIIILQLPCPNHFLTDFDNISKLVFDFCLYLHLTITGPGCSTIKAAGFHLFPKMWCEEKIGQTSWNLKVAIERGCWWPSSRRPSRIIHFVVWSTSMVSATSWAAG